MTEAENNQQGQQQKILMCPLLALQPIHYPTMPDGTAIPAAFTQRVNDCRRDGCAWWQPALEQCGVLVAATSEEILKPRMKATTLTLTEAAMCRVRQALLGRGLTAEQADAAIQAFGESLPERQPSA